MNVEGMWAIYFGDVTGDPTPNSGIIVLETLRLFGGDSAIAYLGSYGVDGSILSATARTWAYNPALDVVTAFGKSGTDTFVQFQGEIKTSVNGTPIVVGQIWEQANPTVKLPASLRWVAELP